MIVTKNIPLKSSHHNKPIVTDVFYKKNNEKKPIIIFCHGYKGFKDWGCWNLMAKKLAKNHFFFLKFNFSHNGGTAKNPIDFPDLQSFGENNFTIELNDLEDIIDWISSNNDYKNELDNTNISLIGHSRGGGIVTIKASENNKISRVISWNGVSDFASRFPKGTDLENWKKDDVAYVLNGRTYQKMPHKYQFYQNFKTHEARLTVKNAVENLTKPQLIITGENDTVVLPIEGENLQKWNPKSELVLIDKMNHTLGGKHPWEENNLPVFLEKVLQISIDFICK